MATRKRKQQAKFYQVQAERLLADSRKTLAAVEGESDTMKKLELVLKAETEAQTAEDLTRQARLLLER